MDVKQLEALAYIAMGIGLVAAGIGTIMVTRSRPKVRFAIQPLTLAIVAISTFGLSQHTAGIVSLTFACVGVAALGVEFVMSAVWFVQRRHAQ